MRRLQQRMVLRPLVARPRLCIGATNTRWVSRVWNIAPREEGLFISTPWFTLILVGREP
jgi:hypothetical protein